LKSEVRMRNSEGTTKLQYIRLKTESGIRKVETNIKTEGVDEYHCLVKTGSQYY
jgi:hypothetical protein